MSDMQGKSCSGTNLGDTRVDPSTLVCHTKDCTNPGFAYYYKNQQQARKAWENWVFCEVCITSLRQKPRLSSRKSHQNKMRKEQINKAMWLVNNEEILQKESEEAINLNENNPNENQTIVQETIHDKADKKS